MNERTGHLINSKFMQYLIPTIFMSMALSLGAIVDGIVCANLISTDALAAVNLCVPVILCFSAIYSILGVGGSTLASTALGRRDTDKADYCFTVSTVLLIGAGILVTVFGMIFMDQMVYFITNGGELTSLVHDFISIFMYGAVIFFIVPGLAYFVRCDGKPGLAAAILIVANIVNLVCDIIYIKYFGLGIRGAALASLTGYFVSLFIFIPYYKSKKRSLKFRRFRYAQLNLINEMIWVGFPSALNSILMFVKLSVINKVALQYLGSDGATVVAICNNCLSFAAIFIGGAAQTMIPIMAVLYGEEDQNGMKFAIKKTLKVVMASSVIMLLIYEVFTTQVAAVFGISEANLMDLSVLAVRLFGLSLPLYGIDYIFMCYYQSTGYKKFASFLTSAQGFIFIVPFVFILSAIFPGKGLGIWSSFLVAEICTFISIILVGRKIAKKENKKSTFLIKDSTEMKELDLSIESQIEKAVGLSEQIINFCKESGISKKVANAAGMSIEEMVINTIEHGYKNNNTEHIDVNVKLSGDNVLIRLRDSGILFNPIEFVSDTEEKVKIHGIEIIREMAESIEYSRTLGMNNLIIRV